MEKNPFKELETQEEAPKEIKEKLMKDVEELKLLMDMGSLFSFNYASVIENFLKTKKKK